MNKKFADKKENEGYNRLMQFNHFLHLQELGKTPKGWYSDASGYTTDGRLLNIENKVRDLNLLDDGYISGHTKISAYSANTIYIESHKMGDLLTDWVTEKRTPLYINYLNDGVIIVYNLSQLKHRPLKEHKRIWSELYQSFEIADRELLRIEDAYIYKRINDTFQLIQRPS